MHTERAQDTYRDIWRGLVFNSNCDYRQTSNINRNLVGNKIVDQSDVVGEPPIGAAPTKSSFFT